MAEGVDRPTESSEGHSSEEMSGNGLDRGLEQLEGYVDSESDALERALDRHFRGPITHETFEAMRDAGMLVLGEDGFGMIIWIASRADRSAAVESFDFSSKVRLWVKGLVAAYGGEINRALHLSDVAASRRDDWEAFGRTVRIDPSTGDYEITTEIQRFDGQRFMLRAGLPSAARLASHTLTTVLAVPSLQSLENEDRQELLEALDAVRERLLAEQPEESV